MNELYQIYKELFSKERYSYDFFKEQLEKAKIINIKTEENQSGSWKIFAGKFEQQGIGPFVDNSEFDKNFSNGKGIRHSINNKIATQLALKTHTQGINR